MQQGKQCDVLIHVEVPLWVVDAPACSLCVVELLENREPWPRPQQARMQHAGRGDFDRLSMQADGEDEKPCLMPFFGEGGPGFRERRDEG